MTDTENNTRRLAATNFANLDKERLIEISRKAGSRKHPKKGFGSLTPEERSRKGKENYLKGKRAKGLI